MKNYAQEKEYLLNVELPVIDNARLTFAYREGIFQQTNIIKKL